MEPSARILVVDLETTGDSPRDCGIIEFGAEWLSSGQNFEARCRPRLGSVIQPRALEINGCDWLDSPDVLSEFKALQHFLAWIGEGPVLIAGQNPYFDLMFLRESCASFGLDPEPIFPRRTIDMHTLAISDVMGQGQPLPARGFYADAVYALLDLPPEPKPHRALNGARWEAAAVRQLLGMPALIADDLPLLSQ